MIHEPAMKRIEDGVVYDAETIKLVFEQLVDNARENSPETASFTAMFVDADDEFVAGDYVPEIWFVIRKVVEDEYDQAGE